MTLRMALLSPQVVLAARVNQTSFSYPIGEVTFDTVTTGAYTDVEIGQTVIFGTTAGADDLGRQRVRGISSSVVQFGRSSEGTHDGEVDLEDNAYITIWRDFRVWSKAPLVTEDGTIYKDYDIAYSDQTEESHPVANAGPWVAGTVNAGTGVLRVQLPGVANTSFPTADGVAISTYGWSLPASGAALVGGYALTDQVIQVDFDPGWHHVKLTVTDANGKSHRAWTCVYARDPDADDSVEGQITSRRIAQNGQTIAVRILEDIPASVYPDGTAFMIWDGEPSSPTDRSHMEFAGWHHTDPAIILSERTGVTRETGLEGLDVLGKMATLPGFPQSIENKSSPSSWLEMKDANMDKYLHYLLHWHSTALLVADWSWSNAGSLYPFVVLGSEAATLFEQVNRRALSIVPNYLLTCNTLGQMKTLIDPMVQAVADRTSTIQATLTADNWLGIEFTHQRSPRSHWLRGEAILAHATQISPIFCVAPGDTPGQGQTETPHGEQLARTQADLNTAEGHRYARLNAPETPFTITLTDDYDIEPANMTWVKLTLDAAYAAQRGLSFTEARGLPLEINITYDTSRTGTVKTVQLLWERETSGNPAVTYIVPSANQPTPPYVPPPSGNTPLPSGAGFGRVYTLVDSTLGRTDAFSAASPAWVDISPSGGLTLYHLMLDPWSPATTGYLATDDGLYKSTNLDNASPTWAAVLDAADILSGTGQTLGLMSMAAGSIHQQNYVVCFYSAGTHARCSFSENGGSSWTHGLISSDFSSLTSVSGAVADRQGGFLNILYSGHNTSGGRKLFKSTNKGATWTAVYTESNTTATRSVCFHVPYKNNVAGDVVYWSLATISGSVSSRYTLNGGSTASEMNGNAKTNTKHGIGTYTQDRNLVYHWKADNTFWLSGNGGISWIQKSASGLSGDVRAAGGFPYASGQFYALTTAGIFVSVDGGETFIDKTGDWAFGFTIAQYYGGTIVPLWTE